MTYSALELADAYLQTGELDHALEVLNEHLRQYPDDDDARRRRIRVEIGRPEAATAALADLDAIETPNARDHASRAVLLLNQGDHAGAVAAYEQAWRLDPANFTEMYVVALKEAGLTGRALEVLARQPKTWRWLTWSGDIHWARNEAQAAVDDFSEALTQLDVLIGKVKDPRLLRSMKSNLLLKRAVAFRALDQLNAAEQDYRDAAQLSPSDESILFNFGVVLFFQGDHAGAITLCRDGWERASDDMRAAMRAELEADPRCQPLLAALIQKD